MIAEFRNWAPLVAIQNEYSLFERNLEEDLLTKGHTSLADEHIARLQLVSDRSSLELSMDPLRAAQVVRLEPANPAGVLEFCQGSNAVASAAM
jgi:hypothetical protein